MTKTLTARLEPSVYDNVKATAKRLGMSINQYVSKLLANSVCAVNDEVDYSQTDVVKGATAEAIILTGTIHTVQTALSKVTRYVIAEGYLWLIRPTANWSRRELHKVSVAPSELTTGNYLKKWLSRGLAAIRQLAETVQEVVSKAWFQQLPARMGKDHVLDRVVNDDEGTLEELERDYCPKTETAKVAKAAALIERYQITDWHVHVNQWKQSGFPTKDGIWLYNRSRNEWSLT